VRTLKFMPNNDNKGDAKSPEQTNAFDDNNDENAKQAASDPDFDDLIIEVDLDELKAEAEGDPARRKS
jgi:hypothetical protein